MNRLQLSKLIYQIMPAKVLPLPQGVGEFALGLITIFIIMVPVYFSESKSTFQCEGEIAQLDKTRPATVSVILTEYRPWARLWNKWDGMLRVEALEGEADSYLALRQVNDSTQHLYLNSGERPIGAYFKKSRNLMLNTGHGFFDGRCAPVES